MMKKIPSKVALKTLGYLIPGNMRVKIINYKNAERIWFDLEPVTIFDNEWNSFDESKNNELFQAYYSEVHRIELGTTDEDTVPCLVIKLVIDADKMTVR